MKLKRIKRKTAYLANLASYGLPTENDYRDRFSRVRKKTEIRKAIYGSVLVLYSVGGVVGGVEHERIFQVSDGSLYREYGGFGRDYEDIVPFKRVISWRYVRSLNRSRIDYVNYTESSPKSERKYERLRRREERRKAK